MFEKSAPIQATPTQQKDFFTFRCPWRMIESGAVKLLVLFLLPMAVCGCSNQKALAQRLAVTDRVVVTNTVEGLSIEVTGPDVERILQAIASAKKESPPVAAAAGLRLEFYRGAEHIGSVNTGGRVFWVDGAPYSDRTDVMQGLLRRLREETDLLKVR